MSRAKEYYESLHHSGPFQAHHVIDVYEHAEKDTVNRAVEWLKENWRNYIMGPDADGCIGFGHWENDFRKAMEED